MLLIVDMGTALLCHVYIQLLWFSGAECGARWHLTIPAPCCRQHLFFDV